MLPPPFGLAAVLLIATTARAIAQPALPTTAPSPATAPAGAPSSASPRAPINACDSLILPQTRSALDAIAASQRLHQGGAPVPQRVRYEGEAFMEAHMMEPGMVRAMPCRMEFILDERGSIAALRESFGPADKAATGTTVFRGSRVASQPAEGAPFTEPSPAEAAEEIRLSKYWLPTTALAAARSNAGACRPGPAIDQGGASLSSITFADGSGGTGTMFLDSASRVVRLERLSSHQRLGDVCDWTVFEDWHTNESGSLPLTLRRFVVGTSTTMRYELTLRGVEPIDPALASGELPAERASDLPTWRTPAPAAMEWVELGPKLWSLEVQASDSRVVVAERETDLVLVGAPDGDEVCNAIADEVQSRFGKPIGLVAFGHHHPASSGGLRALSARGARILAPKGLEAYVRGLLGRSVTLGAPAVAPSAQPDLEFFEGDHAIPLGPAGGGGASESGASSEIRLVNIAEKSAHAFQYIVFYFPEHGLLFEDDLGYFPVSGATSAGPRLFGLSDELEKRAITPTRLVQLWPVKNVHSEVPWADVAGLIKAEREKRERTPRP